jgi:hypothetical protein
LYISKKTTKSRCNYTTNNLFLRRTTMKKTISYFSAMVLTLAGGQEAFAQEAEEGFVESFANFFQPNWERDFSVTVGVKVWLNEWERNSFVTRTQNVPLIGQQDVTVQIQPGNPENQTSDIEPVPIPQLSVRYKWLSVSGSYFPKTEYDFQTTASTTRIESPDIPFGGNLDDRIVVIRNRSKGERREWDASLGVYLHPNVAILGGYKEVKQEISVFRTLDTVTAGETGVSGLALAPDTAELLIQGPTIGIAASVPIAGGFGVYGSYAHGFMDVEITEDNDTEELDGDYDVAEFGFTYTYGTKGFVPFIPLSAATVYAGYRWQRIVTDISEENPNRDDRTDTTNGFATGLNLSW